MKTDATTAQLPPSQLTKSQKKTFGPKSISGYGPGAEITAKVRYDDDCGNGHNTFSITAEVTTPAAKRRGDIQAGGCLHEEIARVFPGLAPLIKWHLVSSDGPMHYVANTVYLAGDRDHNGKRKGEAWSFETAVKFGDFPKHYEVSAKFAKWLQEMGAAVCDCEVLPIYHIDRDNPGKYQFAPKYTLGSYPAAKWHECPFDSEREALEFLAACKRGFEVVRIPKLFSEGKARELDSARRAAVWPEATDEELMLPREELTAKLQARLPALMAEFKAAMESLGFTY